MDLSRLSPASQKILAEAATISTNLEHHFLGVEHLFLALIQAPNSCLKTAFDKQGMDAQRFGQVLGQRVVAVERTWGDDLLFTPRCQRVLQIAHRALGSDPAARVEPEQLAEAIFREGRSSPLRLLRAFGADIVEIQEQCRPAKLEQPMAATPTPLLDRFGRDLTAQAKAGKLGPVIGRDKERDLIAQVLLRKNKNNPVLVGEAGVGKTAVAEGFAQLLVSPSCPEPLRDRRLVELSVSSLVAGTKFRGEFEERLLTLLQEVKAHPEIVLFFDELHTLVGAGASGSGDTLDAANMFKPALARGEIRCIGATTIDEFRRHIEKDPALERRFEPVFVEEPTPEEAVEILKGVSEGLQRHHDIEVTPEAIEAAVELTVRYLPQRRLPDKALDALDQSCARKRLSGWMKEETPDVEASTGRVDADDIRRTLAQWTGIPIEKLTEQEASNLLHLQERLAERVVGQDRAVESVARAIRTARAGLADPNRPTAVFLFLGPTGVGKTELAKSLALLLFGEEKRLTRFDMSEFTEAHSISKLIGSPPGYVGHEQEGQLVRAVRTRPHSVILFDEVEKAHPQLFDLFLQIFDEGRLTSAQGRSVDFRHTVVILTSNLQPVRAEEEKTPRLGFRESAMETEMESAESGEPVTPPREALFQFFRPELVNRIDEIVYFDRLKPVSLVTILDHNIEKIRGLLEPRGFGLEVSDEVKMLLVRAGTSDTFGARELRRVVDRMLRQPLADEILEHPSGGTIHVTLKDDHIVFENR
ncbi:MAG: ATP-dependent Clp protease ATP-binding subunit [Planctomycetota bacterium]